MAMPVLRAQIDHVELFVPNRYEAADWYDRVLGLAIVPEYEDWAADPRGPLMISNDGGSTKLALFESPVAERGASGGFRRVAFRTDTQGLREFLRRAAGEGLTVNGRPLAADAVVNHGLAFSVYFTDPYGHELELTTYDYQACAVMLAEVRGAAT
jgi:catechol 2,3-dioxygenase-like lactoylglutathione lyase family enzyme